MTHLYPRLESTKLRERKALKSAKANLDESARMIARQKVLLEEAEPDSIVRTEFQRSMIRLEAGYEASRTAFEALQADCLVVDAAAGEAHEAVPTKSIADRNEETSPQPKRIGRPQPSWFKTSKRIN